MNPLASTLTITIAFYGMLILLISTISFGFNVITNETLNSDANQNEIVFELEEEAYIDDIPFDTKTIASAYLKEETN